MKRLLGFLGWYLLWLGLAFAFTFGGLFLVMLFADWTLGSLLASGLALPLSALGLLAALPMALLGPGRTYFGSAIGGGLVFSLLVALF